MSNHVVSIRKATEADADAIRDVYLSSRLSAMPWLPLLHSPEEVKHWLTTYVLPFSQVLVAEKDGLIVGYVAIKDDMLDHLYVRPEQQRAGIGTALLEAAKKLSANRLRLYTFARNTLARRFYERHGFRELPNSGARNELGEPDVLLELEIGGETPS